MYLAINNNDITRVVGDGARDTYYARVWWRKVFGRATRRLRRRINLRGFRRDVRLFDYASIRLPTAAIILRVHSAAISHGGASLAHDRLPPRRRFGGSDQTGYRLLPDGKSVRCRYAIRPGRQTLSVPLDTYVYDDNNNNNSKNNVIILSSQPRHRRHTVSADSPYQVSRASSANPDFDSWFMRRVRSTYLSYLPKRCAESSSDCGKRVGGSRTQTLIFFSENWTLLFFFFFKLKITRNCQYQCVNLGDAWEYTHTTWYFCGSAKVSLFAPENSIVLLLKML